MYPLARRVSGIQELRKEAVGSVFCVHVVKACGRVEVWYHAFLTLALGSMTDQRHASAGFTIRERAPGTVRDFRLPLHSKCDLRSVGLLTQRRLVFTDVSGQLISPIFRMRSSLFWVVNTA
jgi:hypothetical protein